MPSAAGLFGVEVSGGGGAEDPSVQSDTSGWLAGPRPKGFPDSSKELDVFLPKQGDSRLSVTPPN